MTDNHNTSSHGSSDTPLPIDYSNAGNVDSSISSMVDSDDYQSDVDLSGDEQRMEQSVTNGAFLEDDDQGMYG